MNYIRISDNDFQNNKKSLQGTAGDALKSYWGETMYDKKLTDGKSSLIANTHIMEQTMRSQ